MRGITLLTAIIMFTFICAASVPAISNQYIDLEVSTSNARYVIGTGSGQSLLYGFPDNIETTFTTIMVDGVDYIYGDSSEEGGNLTTPQYQYLSGNTVNVSSWQINDVWVQEQLSIVPNPRTGNHPDTIQIEYTVQNTSTTVSHDIGIRIVLDTFLTLNSTAPGNDAAPIAEQGYGLVAQETEWPDSGPIGDSWKTFYSLDNYSVEAECGLSTGGVFVPQATKPDMLVIGKWFSMADDADLWTYALTPGPITDTAAAMYWGPTTYTAGAESTFIIYYGIPDVSGAHVDILKSVDKTQNIMYGDTLTYTLTYSNTGSAVPGNINIWDTIPWNSIFINASAGYNTAGNVIWWNIGNITNTYTAYSQWFSVYSNPCQGVEVDNVAESMFFDPYWNYDEVTYSNTTTTTILTCTVTITPTITPTPVPLSFTFKGTYPNPAQKQTNFIFGLSTSAQVNLVIYDVSGETIKKISTAFNDINYNYGMTPSIRLKNITWNCDNNSNKKVASGIYIYSIEAVTQRGEKTKYMGKVAVLK